MSDVKANTRLIELIEGVSLIAGPGYTRGDIDKMIEHARDQRAVATPVVEIARVLVPQRAFPNDSTLATASEIFLVVRRHDTKADYPHWDEKHATTLVSTEDVYVQTEPVLEGANIEIRRTVWKKARRRADQHILWIGAVAVIPRDNVAEFVRDVVAVSL